MAGLTGIVIAEADGTFRIPKLNGIKRSMRQSVSQHAAFSLSDTNLFITVGEAGTKGVRCQMLSRDPSRQISAISPALPILLASFANDAKPFITIVEAGMKKPERP